MIPFDAMARQGREESRSTAASNSTAGGGAMAEVRAAIACAGRTSEHAAVHRQAADPEDGDELAHARLRRARRRGVQGQRQRRARRPRCRDARDPARSGGARRAQDRSRVRAHARARAVLDRDDPRAGRHDRRLSCRTASAAGRAARPLFDAPTVFNYYPADYTLAGGNIPGAGVRRSTRRPNS